MKNLYKVLILTLSVFPGLCSCSLTGEENDNPASELTIEVDNPLISADGESCAKLTVKLGGKDVTSEVTFYDAAKNVPVNLPDAKFSTTTPGKYSFWASYKAYISSSISVVAISAKVPEVPADPQPESLDFSRKVLVTQFTGTACGFCPFMINILRKFAAEDSNKDKYVLAACHTYTDSDPAFLSTNIDGAMGVTGYPSVVLDLNKSTKFSDYNSYTKFQSIFNAEYSKESAQAGISVATVLDGNQLVAKCSIKAAQSQEYRIAAWLLEDGIKANQANNGAEGDFSTHDNCVRLILGQNTSKDFTGTSCKLAKGETASQFIMMDVDPSWVKENLHVIVFVCTNTRGSCMVNNVVDCPINSSVSYSYAN